ncbi:MAG: ATP-binding protein [Candidatus Moduliflexus flocculans]|nr:ATP-binding protein [Candidatus Moduliflexus flocculans]
MNTRGRRTIHLSVEADFPSVRLLAAACHGVLAEWGLAPDRRSLLELAVVGGRDERRAPRLRRPRRPRRGRAGPRGKTIALSVLDSGVSFDPTLVPPPREPDPDDPSTWPEGGMGLPIIRAACDELHYVSDGGKNRLTLHLNAEELEVL